MKVAGHFNGTGADVFICIGFVPDFVRLINLEASAPGPIVTEWSKHFVAADCGEGFTVSYAADLADGTGAVHLATAGINPYYGGDLLTTSNQTTVTYGEGVYLGWDEIGDYRYGPNKGPGGISGDAVSDNIDTWTLDTAANRSGHFNEDVNGTYIGEGSRINIDNQWYVVISVTAAAGEAADEVVLSAAKASGTIYAIKGKYGLKPIAVGKVTPPGFKVEYATLNVNDAMIFFEAGTYDN